jgi:hypothetical protein
VKYVAIIQPERRGASGVAMTCPSEKSGIAAAAATATSAAREPNSRRVESQRKVERSVEWNAAATRIARSPSPSSAVATWMVQATSGG